MWSDLELILETASLLLFWGAVFSFIVQILRSCPIQLVGGVGRSFHSIHSIILRVLTAAIWYWLDGAVPLVFEFQFGLFHGRLGFICIRRAEVVIKNVIFIVILQYFSYCILVICPHNILTGSIVFKRFTGEIQIRHASNAWGEWACEHLRFRNSLSEIIRVIRWQCVDLAKVGLHFWAVVYTLYAGAPRARTLHLLLLHCLVNHLILQDEPVVRCHHWLEPLAWSHRIKELWPCVSLRIVSWDGVIITELLRNGYVSNLRLSETTKGHIYLLSFVFIALCRLELGRC